MANALYYPVLWRSSQGDWAYRTLPTSFWKKVKLTQIEDNEGLLLETLYLALEAIYGSSKRPR